MLTSEQRATMSAMWRAHWEGWKESGESMAGVRAAAGI